MTGFNAACQVQAADKFRQPKVRRWDWRVLARVAKAGRLNHKIMKKRPSGSFIGAGGPCNPSGLRHLAAGLRNDFTRQGRGTLRQGPRRLVYLDGRRLGQVLDPQIQVRMERRTGRDQVA